MKKILTVASILLISSCGNYSSSGTRNYSSGQSTTQSSLDCSGFKYNLTIPYGIDTPTGITMAGQPFATVVAVDAKDGKMKVTILPPNGQTTFPVAILNELNAKGYVIRVVSCRENMSSVGTGYSVTGVCNTLAQVNLVGASIVTSGNFNTDGFVVDGVVVHATADGTTKLKPNFLMITATASGNVDKNPIGEFMVAYGRSPYYNGCYTY